MTIEMSMKLSPRQAGKLYQKCMKQEQQIKDLTKLVKDFSGLFCGHYAEDIEDIRDRAKKVIQEAEKVD